MTDLALRTEWSPPTALLSAGPDAWVFHCTRKVQAATRPIRARAARVVDTTESGEQTIC